MQRSLPNLGLVALLLGSLLVGCTTTSQTGNLLRAQSNLRRGDAEDALAIANFVLGGPPANAEIGAQASLIKGLSLEALGREQEAACVYQFIQERYSDTPSGAQARGRALHLSVSCEN